ncbi:hypothetical protein DUI87_25753 [Hirundo rustica rustica]|nr:hypothetical protein DUI87_25753 [Hirundo rustica rustica]
MVYKKLIKILEFVLGMFSLWFFRPTLRPSSSSMFWGFINNCTQFVRGGVGDEALQPLLSFFSFESVTSLLEKWKKANWQRRGKPIWAADEWKDIATRVEKLPVKVRHVDAHVPKSRANKEHRNNEQIDQAAKIEVSKIDLDWQHKGELFLAR